MLGDDGQSLYVVFMGTKHMRDLLADANFLQEAVWKSKDPDKQQVISISLPLLWQFVAFTDNHLIVTCHVQGMLAKLSTSMQPYNVGDAETSTNSSRLGIPCNLRSSAGQCSCAQRVPSQGSGHSCGGPVCTCQKAGQTLGLVRYVTPNLLCLLCGLPA